MAEKREADTVENGSDGQKKRVTAEPVFYNIAEWIKQNEKFFLPPVCNKMM